VRDTHLQARIASIEPGSIAEELGLLPGDRVLEINGQAMLDVIDYQQHCASRHVVIKVARGDKLIECEIEKDEEEPIGVVFTNVVFDGVRRCRNRCIFCFVDNLPPGMRSSLYLKDDDYRLSFLHGNFITLSNLTERDWERILRLRLSPLYVSVHATDPDVRARMMGHADPEGILPKLRRLVAGGIEVHAQIVLCPGINDGPVLDATARDLAALYPGVASLAVVPVGLTRFARRESIRPVRVQEAEEVLGQVETLQTHCLDTLGTRFIFAADELYLRAGRAVPAAEEYEEFPQFSNGVGLLASFYDEEDETIEHLGGKDAAYRRVTCVTGVEAEPAISRFCARLAQAANIQARTLAVRNGFFGDSVTVAGLLTGQDICRALRNVHSQELVLVPDVALRDGRVFLDDMSLDDLRGCTDATVLAVPAGPRGIVEAIMGRVR